MRCFYHQEKEAVGLCKSCGKGLCAECAVDIGKGLACRARCEESARALVQLLDRNIQLSTNPTKAQLVTPTPVQRSGPPADFIAAQLASHIRETRHFRLSAGAFSLLVGLIVLSTGLMQRLALLEIVGACFVGFGALCVAQARRGARQPRLSETQTK